MTRADCLVLVFAVALLPWLYLSFWGGGEPGQAVRILDGAGTETFASLQSDRRIEIEGPLGASIIEIRDGGARFITSPCQGKQCIHAGWQKHGGDITACLPNRISLAVIGGAARFDSINF